MNSLRRFICWILRRHTNPRLMAIDKGIYEDTEHWVCRDCNEAWTEYTGRVP